MKANHDLYHRAKTVIASFSYRQKPTCFVNKDLRTENKVLGSARLKMKSSIYDPLRTLKINRTPLTLAPVLVNV